MLEQLVDGRLGGGDVALRIGQRRCSRVDRRRQRGELVQAVAERVQHLVGLGRQAIDQAQRVRQLRGLLQLRALVFARSAHLLLVG